MVLCGHILLLTMDILNKDNYIYVWESLWGFDYKIFNVVIYRIINQCYVILILVEKRQKCTPVTAEFLACTPLLMATH